MLGYSNTNAVASGVYHCFEVSGRVAPVVDGALGCVFCASKHGQVGTEAVGVARVDSGLALLRSVMPGISLVGAGLGGVHQGLADRQFRHPVGLSGLVDKLDHLLAYFQVVRQADAVPAGGGFQRGGDGGADRQNHALALPITVGDGNLCGPRPLGDGYPEGQHLLHRYCVWGAGGDGVLRTAGTDDDAAALSHLQGTALIAAHPDGWGLCCYSRDGEDGCEDGCRQYGRNVFFRTSTLPS